MEASSFLVEKSLALDNVFVMVTIFAALGIGEREQRRVLFWGILGVIVLRVVMISLGAVLVTRFAWALDLLAVGLVLTGIRLMFLLRRSPAERHGATLALLRRLLRITRSRTATDSLSGRRTRPAALTWRRARPCCWRWC